MYKVQWHTVKFLSKRFLNRWKQEYLNTLKPRRKWQYDQTYWNPGDIVLLKDSNSHKLDACNGGKGKLWKRWSRLKCGGTHYKEWPVKDLSRTVTELVLFLSGKEDHEDTVDSDRK